MLKQIKTRLKRIEQRIFSKLPFLPGDNDDFLVALGVSPDKYRVNNPDGSTGYDAIRALNDLAAEDWRGYV